MKGLVKSLESAPVGDGDLLGRPFKVLPYQRKFLAGGFRERNLAGGLDPGPWRGKIRLGVCVGVGQHTAGWCAASDGRGDRGGGVILRPG